MTPADGSPRLGWSARASDAGETRALGAALGREAPDGAVILLEGSLGAGKTAFAKGVGSGCGVRDPITSPTYNLVLQYRGRRPFTHVDLYRIEDPAGLETLDLDEILSDEGVTCVEWPALLEGRVRPPLARVRIRPVPGAATTRRLDSELIGPGWQTARDAVIALGAVPA